MILLRYDRLYIIKYVHRYVMSWLYANSEQRINEHTVASTPSTKDRRGDEVKADLDQTIP